MLRSCFAALTVVSLFAVAGCGAQSAPARPAAPGQTAAPDAGSSTKRDAGKEPDAGLAADGGQDSGSPRDLGDGGTAQAPDAGAPVKVVEACTAAWLLDGGALPEKSLDATQARAARVAEVDGFEDGPGCRVISQNVDGTFGWTEVFDPAGHLLERTVMGPDGGVVYRRTQTFDGRGRLLSSADGTGASRRVIYDGDEVARVEYANGSVRVWRYDGGVVNQIDERAADGGVSSTWKYRYTDGLLTGIGWFWGDIPYAAVGQKFDRYPDGGLERDEEQADMFAYQDDIWHAYDSDGQLTDFEWGLDESDLRASYGYDAQGRRSSGSWKYEGGDAVRDGGAAWTFEVRPGVDVLAADEAFQSFRGEGSGGHSAVWRRVRKNGRWIYEESDVNGDCLPDGVHLLQRDRAGTLRVDTRTGSLGEARIELRGDDCPRGEQGSAYDPVAPFGVGHLDLTPRNAPVDSAHLGLPQP